MSLNAQPPIIEVTHTPLLGLEHDLENGDFSCVIILIAPVFIIFFILVVSLTPLEVYIRMYLVKTGESEAEQRDVFDIARINFDEELVREHLVDPKMTSPRSAYLPGDDAGVRTAGVGDPIKS